LHDLGKALDALVHAIQSGDALADGLARRSHELWLEQHDSVIEWKPTELRADGRLVLAADTHRGRFIFCAHAAGLRALAIRTRSVTADVMNLARHLAALEDGEIEPSEFADWVWRGAAVGFDAAQAAAGSQLGEGLIAADLERPQLWVERSERAVEQWNDLALKAGQALDAAMLAERFCAPLERMRQRAEQGGLAFSNEDANALRAAADAPAAWAVAEAALLIEQPSLRGTLPRSHLTFLLLDLIEGGAPLDRSLLDVCGELDAAQGARNANDAIDFPALGAAIASRLLLLGAPKTAWLELAAPTDSPLLTGLTSHVLARSETEAPAREAMVALLERWGAAETFARLDPARIQPQLGVALLSAALQTCAEPTELATALARMPVETALMALTALPALLPAAQVTLERLIVEQPSSSGPLLPALVQSSAAAAGGVGAALLATQAARFAPTVLAPTFLALVQAGVGARFVLPLWRARGTSSSARLAALSALQGDPFLLAEALDARATGMLEPPEIREALEELRWRAR
jgi:hypothetical protein